ncbi:ion transporter [Apiospora arundinis]
MSERTSLLVRFPESGSLVRSFTSDWRSTYRKARRETQRFLSSKAKHWVILALVVLDVAGILSDIFIALITCELKMEDEAWVQPTRGALTTFSLVMSCLFLLELLLCLWAEGIRYLSNWFHCFDAFVIVGSFVIDLLEHGIAEEIASLIVILRLWRFVKIVNELSVEASEQIEEIQRRLEELEKENGELRRQLGQNRRQGDEEEALS